jgi:predicted RNA-binding Zn ribbon-like protein
MMVSTMISTAHAHVVDLEGALAFVNTLEYEHGEPHDDLATSRQAVAWLAEHGLVHEDAVVTVGSGPAALRRIRRLRAALRELAEASHDGRIPDAPALAEINRVLRAREILELVPSGDALRLDHRHGRDPIDEALARLAEPIVREIGAGRTERLRPCANDGCRWLFYDASRQGRRRWCDMASCGTRAKAARHRARVKGESASLES